MGPTPTELRPTDRRPTDRRLDRIVARLTGLDLAATGASRRPPLPGAALTVASYNVHKCIGTDGVFDPARTAAVIAEIDPDLIALQEADRRLGRRDGRLDLADLEHRTRLRLVPLAAGPVSHGWHGNALFVRRGRIRRLHRLPLPHAEPRGAVLAELDIDGLPLRVIGAHLGLIRATRRRQLAAIDRLVGGLPPMPTLLMGDFNEWRAGRPGSPLDALSPRFAPLDLHRASFPAPRPRLALDRILGTPAGLVRDFAVHDSPLARLASDHLPVVADIDLAAAAGLAAGLMPALLPAGQPVV